MSTSLSASLLLLKMEAEGFIFAPISMHSSLPRGASLDSRSLLGLDSCALAPTPEMAMGLELKESMTELEPEHVLGCQEAMAVR